MKKIICLLCCLICISSCYATEIVNINFNLQTDENIEKQMTPIFSVLEEAKMNNDLDKYIEACERGYKLKKTGNPKSIKIYNDILSASAIEYNLQAYQINKDKKYLNHAYKWSKIAIDDRTEQVYSIQAAIILAGFKLDLDSMKKAYKLYRTVDIEGAERYLDDYQNTYNATKNLIIEKSNNRKNKWRNALYNAALGIQNFGQATQQLYNNQHYTNCYTIGNNVYCNSY